MGSSPEYMEQTVEDRQEREVQFEAFTQDENGNPVHTLYGKTFNYWIACQAWNGHPIYSKLFNIGQLLNFLRRLAEVSTAHYRLQTVVLGLQSNVIVSRRCRKKKPINNTVSIEALRQARLAKEHSPAQRLIG